MKKQNKRFGCVAQCEDTAFNSEFWGKKRIRLVEFSVSGFWLRDGMGMFIVKPMEIF